MKVQPGWKYIRQLEARNEDLKHTNAELITTLDEAVEHVSVLASLVELAPDYTPGTDLYTAGEVAKLFVARAKGGTP